MSERTRFDHLTGGEPPAALLFDLDGTLLDSLPDLATAIDLTLAELGRPAAGEQRVGAWIGDGARQLVVEALHHAGLDGSPAAIDAAVAIYQRHYAACCTERSRLFPGAQAALEQGALRGIRMACVTNKGERFTTPLLAHFALGRLLPVAVCGDTLPQRKPDPAPLLFACEQLGVMPERALMVGDSRNDVLAARAAGMAVVCVDYGYNHGRPILQEGADAVIASLCELFEPQPLE